jgi:hypothetical protein
VVAVSGECQVHGPDRSRVDGAFDNLGGFTVKLICPADVVPSLAGPDVTAATAGEVSQNATSVLNVGSGVF